MREIKFRAWYKPLSIMLESGAIESINFETKVVGAYIEFDDKGFHTLRMSDFELMQYTGLKDKNGKEIYEGDILQYLDGVDCSSENGFDWHETLNVGVMEWDADEARFTVTNRSMVDLETFFEEITENAEVIGNVWEHPHLLKEE